MPDSASVADAIATILAEHKGGEVLVLDMAESAGWTDYFVIATATSSAHLRGLARFAEEYCDREKLELRSRPRIADDEEWVLMDLGDVVVHLMTSGARSFYELEKLWFQAKSRRVELPAPASGV